MTLQGDKILLDGRPAVRWAILSLISAISLAFVVANLLTADIFLAHTSRMLRIGYWAQVAGPAVSALCCFLASCWLCLFLPVRIRSRVLAAVLVVPAISLAVLTRIPYIEWAFARASAANLAPLAGFADVGEQDMVIGVEIGGESRAYPVRYLAFHHMLNDRLAAAAILPTY